MRCEARFLDASARTLRGSRELERATDRDMPGNGRPTRSGHAIARLFFPAPHPRPRPRGARTRVRCPEHADKNLSDQTAARPFREKASQPTPTNYWSRPWRYRYQHGFSTRSGNDGKQPECSGQKGREADVVHSRADRPASRLMTGISAGQAI